jgi:hypothetical protein
MTEDRSTRERGRLALGEKVSLGKKVEGGTPLFPAPDFCSLVCFAPGCG